MWKNTELDSGHHRLVITPLRYNWRAVLGWTIAKYYFYRSKEFAIGKSITN